MQTNFLSIRIIILSNFVAAIFLMHRIGNVITKRVLKIPQATKAHGCLSDHQSHMFSLTRPAFAEHLAQQSASSEFKTRA